MTMPLRLGRGSFIEEKYTTGVEVLRAPIEDPGIWYITNFHWQLVNHAFSLLEETYGIKPSEIKTECYVKVGKEKYLVDLLGFQEGKPFIAVECGACSLDKLRDLKTVFEKVIHISGGIQTPEGDSLRIEVLRKHAERITSRSRKWFYGSDLKEAVF